VPGHAAAEDKQNAGETCAIGDARPSAFRPKKWSWQERFNKIPQRIGKQCRGHTRSRYFADEDQVSAVLLHALSHSDASTGSGHDTVQIDPSQHRPESRMSAESGEEEGPLHAIDSAGTFLRGLLETVQRLLVLA